MIDAVVGGGGLIQIPALINVLPGVQDATIFGTNKIASVCGSSVAARSYVGKVTIPWHLVLPAAMSAFAMSFLGAATVSYIPQGLLRPLVLFLIVVMAIYIFKKKDFGAIQRPREIGTRERVLSVLIGGGIGFMMACSDRAPEAFLFSFSYATFPSTFCRPRHRQNS